ncbi:MAG: glycosyltransferase family 2 protein [Gimesia sp.]|nr:glycosyltransferase family 2 protein [Gimesia sp.]
MEGLQTPLSLIVPVYNEAENIPRLIDEIDQHLHQPFRVLIVYDFEEDTTLPVARQLAETRPYLSLVKNNLGRGPANALRAGFQEAQSGPALVVMADLSDDLRDVARMLELYQEGCRVVCASRYMRGGQQQGGPLLKRTLSRFAGLSLYYFAGFPTHDATNNFRLYDAALVNEMQIESEHGFEIALELTAKAFVQGEKIGEIPTIWKDRSAGESRFQLFRWLPKYLRWYRYALFGRWRIGKRRTS